MWTNSSFVHFLALALRLAAALQWSAIFYWAIKRESLSSARLWTFQAFILAAIGYLTTRLAFVFEAPAAVTYLTLFLAFTTGPLLWLSAKALFDENYRLKFNYILAVILCGIAAMCTHAHLPTSRHFYVSIADLPTLSALIAFLSPQAFTLCFVLLAIIQVQKGKADDLIEARIRNRRLFIWVVGSITVIVDLAEFVMKAVPGTQDFLELGTSSFIILIGYAIARNLQDQSISILDRVLPAPASTAAQPLDTNAQIELTRLIETEKIFTQPQLDLERLAQLLELPPYRLRRHINKVLGHTNFSQFLNTYRVSEAKRILSDTSLNQIPIYNLAIELGYGSITSFNRSFKDQVGLSPTEYRDSLQNR